MDANMVLAMCVDASQKEAVVDGRGDGWVSFPSECEDFISGLLDEGLIEPFSPGSDYFRPTEQGKQMAAQWRPQ